MVKSYKFNVKMTCGGCSGAVNRALGKMEGLESYNIDLDKQTVVVVPATATYDEVYEKIKKTGKEIISGEEVDEEATVGEPITAAAPLVV